MDRCGGASRIRVLRGGIVIKQVNIVINQVEKEVGCENATSFLLVL